MKQIYFVFCFLMAASAIMAKQPELTFKNDKKFKIVQFTDIHLRLQDTAECQKVYNRIDKMVKLEQPDLLIFTGDMITSKNARPLLTNFLAELDKHKTPWCVVYGNHDAEQDLTRQEMSSMIVKSKYTLDRLNDKGELADLEIGIGSNEKPENKAFYLYCMDSHDYPTVKGMGGYGWFYQEQIEWLRSCCSARTDEKGEVVPSMAFFHIPLVEYIDAWAPNENPRHGNSKLCMGIRGESVCCGALNTGMFAAMRETGSVVATFAGHDHDNDYVGLYKGIALCYGRFSGGNSTYANMQPGVRVISITENSREFETWIRDDDGRCLRHVRCNGKQLTEQPNAPRGALYGTKTEF